MSFSIVTRYNVRATFGLGDGSSYAMEDVNDSAWLDERRDLFEQFCAPYVRAQNDQEFTWFVFVDNDMPQQEVDWIIETGKCEVIRCASQTDGINQIRERITAGYDMALTLRLDSDDSIAPSFVEQMRAAAETESDAALESGEGRFICFSDGVEHDTRADKWFDREYPGNPFIGFMEPVVSGEPAKLIFHKSHYEIPKFYEGVTIATEGPMWCIRVHGGNVANQVKGSASDQRPATFATAEDLV